MHIQLNKNIYGELCINDERLVGVFGPKYFESSGFSDNKIIKHIKTPIGTPPLSELVKKNDDILIVTDDNTRLTPLKRLLPPILNEMHEAGVKKENITILIGLGTHRAMTVEEIKEKYGKSVFGNYRIINHAWDDPANLVSVGCCDSGFEIVINKLVQKADFIMSVGSIVPHATCGFSGGGKTIIPGICGEKTIEDTHWAALRYSMSEILGNYENQVRRAIISVCRKINLQFIVNAVLFNGDSIFGLVAGDVEKAHYRGAELCQEIYGVTIPEKADIVIAEAFPTDIDLRQAIKAICSAGLVCRDGGIIILVAECAEGLAPQFPAFSKYGFKNPEKLFQDVENKNFTQKIMAYTLIAIGRIISNKVNAILVSPNIKPLQAEQMGFLWVADLQDAVNRAFQIAGKDSKAVVLKQAGEMLPIFQS